MNPYGDVHFNSDPSDGAAPGSLLSPPLYSAPDPFNSCSHNPSHSATLPSPSIIQTGHSYVTVVTFTPYQATSGQSLVLSPNRSNSSLLGTDQGSGVRSGYHSSVASVTSPVQNVSPVSPSTPNPYPGPSYHVSVIIPSPDLRLSPLQARCSQDTYPDLECSICFSQFNNVFRCPKMLQCNHTFCLECLARINIKSAQPNTIQCPLCRGLTPLPMLGLPTLATDVDILTCLPAAMQRAYSIRFLRSKGKLQVKRSSAGNRRWRRRSNCSLDVGLPSPPAEGRSEASGVSEALYRLTGRPACRAFLLTSVVMMMMLLIGIIIFLLTFRTDGNSE